MPRTKAPERDLSYDSQGSLFQERGRDKKTKNKAVHSLINRGGTEGGYRHSTNRVKLGEDLADLCR